MHSQAQELCLMGTFALLPAAGPFEILRGSCRRVELSELGAQGHGILRLELLYTYYGSVAGFAAKQTTGV